MLVLVTIFKGEPEPAATVLVKLVYHFIVPLAQVPVKATFSAEQVFIGFTPPFTRKLLGAEATPIELACTMVVKFHGKTASFVLVGVFFTDVITIV